MVTKKYEELKKLDNDYNPSNLGFSLKDSENNSMKMDGQEE
jgi:hypothetical protein